MDRKTASTENPFWYREFDLKQIRKLKGDQPILDFDAAESCRFYITTMKAKNSQDGIPSISIDFFKDHYELAFDLTSRKDATEICQYPELLGELLKMELKFYSLVHVTELILLGKRMSSFALDMFCVVGKKI